jgi:uncharacterized protein (DUF302 family)
MKIQWMAAVVTAAQFTLAPAAFAAAPDIAVQSIKGDFQDIKSRVVQAIEDRGLVINYTSHIGAMLERTGKDIGSMKRVFRDAELLEFCSAVVSRGAMEADPHFIVYCPYGIAVYTLPRRPDTVYVSYRKLAASGAGQAQKSLVAVDKLLGEIVAAALK